jgi:hypothetical protein
VFTPGDQRCTQELRPIRLTNISTETSVMTRFSEQNGPLRAPLRGVDRRYGCRRQGSCCPSGILNSSPKDQLEEREIIDFAKRTVCLQEQFSRASLLDGDACEFQPAEMSRRHVFDGDRVCCGPVCTKFFASSAVQTTARSSTEQIETIVPVMGWDYAAG